jgi:hypothetical protein
VSYNPIQKAKFALLALFAVSTASVVIGITPVKIAGVESQQKASATSAWWGDYWRVDGNTANAIAYQLNRGAIGAGFASAGISQFFGPGSFWPAFQSANLAWAANTLNECARIQNSAYFKVYSSRVWVSGYGYAKLPYAVGASCN